MRVSIPAAILILCLGFSSCKKDAGDSSYLKAMVNGASWETSNISVIHTTGPTGIVPAEITGFVNNTAIALRINNTNPGSYPFKNEQTLPLVLISFDVENFESGHRITWSTATETDISSFQVELSADGLNWATVATVNPTGSGSNYQATHDINSTLGTNSYYRLKIIETNGGFQYSSIRAISGNYIAYYRHSAGPPKRGYNGNLEITSFNVAKQVISGRFYFKAKTAAGQVFDITAGEFQVKY